MLALWIVLGIIGLLVLPFLALLLVLGRSSANEPRFIKSLRGSIFSEYSAYIGYGLYHPALLFSGATRDEKRMALPGDAMVPHANLCVTRAITINATAERIWPWLVQMGGGRAFWYSWSPVHTYPEFKHQISPYRIVQEWQKLEVGDVLLDGSARDDCTETKGAWRVIEVHDKSNIVLFSARDLREGIEFDPQKTRPKGMYAITSWVFQIISTDNNKSRLLIRTKAEIGPKWLGLVIRLVLGNGDTVMQRTMLLGIKQRAESLARSNVKN